MKKSFVPVLIICMICSLSLFGQKKDKVMTATQSALTGLPLPEGSQQDKRGLSTYSAKVLFELESKKAGVGVKTPEVFLLPPVSKSRYNADSLVAGLQALGWSIQPVQGDQKYAWLQKDNRYVMAFFDMNKNGTDFYLAEAAGIPGIAAPSGVVATTNGHGQTGNPAIPGAVPDIPGQGQPVTGNQVNSVPSGVVSTTSGQGQTGNPAGNTNIQNTPAVPAVNTGVVSTGNNLPGAGSFVYHTTNFDDGWTSTIADDKVIVTRGNLRVFIYQSSAHTDDSRSAGRNWAWDNIVSRDFNIRSTQYRDHGEVMSALQAPYIEGQAVEKSSGQNVFIAMYCQSVSGQMLTTLAIAQDEQTIRNAFPKAEDKYESDLNAMRGYNRFAVDARDLTGTWSGGDGAAMGYYDAITGSFLGLSTSSISYKFVFGNNNNYSSVHQGAGGTVGNTKAYHEEYKGTYALDKWSISMNNRWKGETENYNCYFEVVRGGRILHMQNKQAIALWYHLMKTN